LLSSKFNYKIDKAIPLILYKTHSDFEQTNVLLSFIPEGVGAFAEPIRNRMVMPIDLPDERLQKLITHELTHIFQFEFFFQRQVSKALTQQVPQWFVEGMASYMAKDENSFSRMILRDYVYNDRIPSITTKGIYGYMAYRFGHAVFDFIEKQWGEEGLRRFFYEYRSNLESTVEKALKRAFDIEPLTFDRLFRLYLRKLYAGYFVEWDEPENYGTPLLLKENFKDSSFLSPVLLPSAELFASITTYKNDIDVALFTLKEEKVFENLTPGLIHRFEYISSQFLTTGPEMGRDLAISPDGDYLAFFGRKERGKNLYIMNLVTKKLEKEIPIPIDQPLSPAFSPDGKSIAFQGYRNDRADIYILNLEDKRISNLTDDIFFDGSPSYSPDGNYLVYSSFRGSYAQLIRISLQTKEKEQLTFLEGNHTDAVFSPDGKTIYFTWDREDFPNIYRMDLELKVVEQITKAGTGCFQPYVGKRGDGKELLLYVGFFKGNFKIYSIVSPRAILSFEEKETGKPSEEIFQPEIFIPFQKEKVNEKFKSKLEFTYGSVDAGISTDQRITGRGYLRFSDILGNRYLFLTLETLSTYSDIGITYWNLKNRTQWGYNLYDTRTYYLMSYYEGSSRIETEEAYRLSGGSIYLQYPFNLYTRVSFGLGYQYAKLRIPKFEGYVDGQPKYDFVEYKQNYPYLLAMFNVDNTVETYTGPLAGTRGQISYIVSPRFSGQQRFIQSQMDLRHYIYLSEKSQFAMRLVGFYSAGEYPTIFAFGGIDTLRGYKFREFFGTRGFFTNFEFRFPLAYEFNTPIFKFYDIQGRVFLDIGGAWFKGEPFQFIDNGRLKDAKSSYGLGFTIRFLGFDWNWDWASLWDFKERDKNMRYSFWIGYKF
ncbi:MAG: hypothetical protein WHV67_04720, partial [Thermoanaerobaculia bacterium]